MLRKELIARLAKWEHLGVTLLDSSTCYYGARSPTQPLGWLHHVYCPADRERFHEFENKNPFQKAFRYPQQLLEFNGVNIFSQALYLLGLHLSQPRHALDLPYNMVIVNISYRALAKLHNGLIIGGANFSPSSFFYIETENGEVLAVDRATEKQVFVWSDYAKFLVSELDRLDELFDQEGRAPSNFEKAGVDWAGTNQ